MKEFGISKPTSDRLVYLRKGFYPLIFIEELLRLTNKLGKRFVLQEKIEFLKANQPPLKIVKAPKVLTKSLCKIAGAHAADGTVADSLFCITDGYRNNIRAFGKWLEKEFALNYRAIKISENTNKTIPSAWGEKVQAFINCGG